MIIPGAPAPDVRCSRTACGLGPEWEIHWRNPKIHTADRVKVWLSCGDHRDYFVGYLEQRNFPVSAVAYGGEK